MVTRNKIFFNGQSFARKDQYGTVSFYRICRSSLQVVTDSYFLHFFQSMHSLLLIVRNHGGGQGLSTVRNLTSTHGTKAIVEEAFTPNTGPLRSVLISYGRIEPQVL